VSHQLEALEQIALVMAETEDVESLSKLLGSDDANTRLLAVLALANKDEPAAIFELLKYERREGDPDVLSVLAKVLGNVARKTPCIAPEIADRLMVHLEHVDPLVRRAAIIGLTTLLKTGRNRELKAILGLAQAARADGDVFNRYAAAEGLYEWGVPHLQDASGTLRHRLDHALFSMLRETLEACAKGDHPEVQRACSGALAAMGETA